ncbi:unnamed protein product [Ectocarpus sp. 6 AP-2014]
MAVLNEMKSGEEGGLPRNMDWVLAHLHSGMDDVATFLESLVHERLNLLRRIVKKFGAVAENPPPQFRQLEVALRGVLAVLQSLDALPNLPTMDSAPPIPEEHQHSPALPLPWDAYDVAQSLYDFAAQLEERQEQVLQKIPLQEKRHDFQAGEALCRQAVRIWEHFLWHAHPQLAQGYATLGALTKHQGKFEEANCLYLRAIESGEKTLRPDHPDYPDLAMRRNNRAGLLEDQDKHAAAEQKCADRKRAEARARLERKGTDASPVGHTSSSGDGGSEHLFRVQVASFADLDEFTRDNRETLGEVKRLLGQPASADTLSSGTDLIYKLGELDRLIAMAKTLGELAWRYTADLDIQRKEISSEPGRKAYNVTVRSGLCNAYLAASVVCSHLIYTGKVGVMSKAGAALQLMSPLVCGLAGFAGAALKAGDSFVQTRWLEKITDLAPDAVECSKLAKSLALRLTDGLTDGNIATTYDANEHLARHAAGVRWGAGGSKLSQGSGALPDGVSEEAVMEWFVDRISEYEPGNCGATTETREFQAGKRLGTRHLHMLLTAVGGGCLQGTNNTGEKIQVDRLLQVVLPEANIHPTATSSAGEDPRMRPPVLASAHDAGLDKATELARLTADWEALKEKHEKHLAEIEALRSEVTMIEGRLPKPHVAPAGSVDVGAGQVLSQARNTKTKEEFWRDAEKSASATDEHTLNSDEHQAETQNTQAHVHEVDSRLDVLEATIVALTEELRGMRPPVLASAHYAGLDEAAELATSMADWEALKEKYLAEIEPMELENMKLRQTVSMMKMHLPKPRAAPAGSVDVGAGQVLSQARNTKTKEEFWRDAEKSASATDEHTLNSDEHQAETQNTQAHVHEVDSRLDVLEATIVALTEELRGEFHELDTAVVLKKFNPAVVLFDPLMLSVLCL